MEKTLRATFRGLLKGSLFAFSAIALPLSAQAQDSVIVDLGALDVGAPQLLVPEESGSPVTLRPPVGAQPSSSENAIKLRPPSSMVKRTAPAPTTERAVANTAEPPAPAPRTTAPEVAKAPPAPPAPRQPAPPAAPQRATPPAENTPTEVARATPPPAAPRPQAPANRNRPTPITPDGIQEEAEAAEPAEVETAALVEPERAPGPPNEFTIPYGTGDSSVPERAHDNLRLLAGRMVKNPDLRVEFIAYASDPEESVSRSRRLSLERAVNVRKMLLDSGVDSSRVNLRALGEQSGDGDPDRIDVFVTTR